MLGTELRARRRALGFTQDELAELLDVSQATIAKWETGVHPVHPARLVDLALRQLEERKEAPVS